MSWFTIVAGIGTNAFFIYFATGIMELEKGYLSSDCAFLAPS